VGEEKFIKIRKIGKIKKIGIIRKIGKIRKIWEFKSGELNGIQIPLPPLLKGERFLFST
jgi:hypothetical protein